MTQTIFALQALPANISLRRARLLTKSVVVHSDGLGAFRGLMIAVPFGVGMWAGLYYLVRAFL